MHLYQGPHGVNMSLYYHTVMVGLAGFPHCRLLRVFCPLLIDKHLGRGYFEAIPNILFLLKFFICEF